MISGNYHIINKGFGAGLKAQFLLVLIFIYTYILAVLCLWIHFYSSKDLLRV